MIRTLTQSDRNAEPLRVSFEFFPPKSEAMATQLWDTVKRLEPMVPDFVSVTYGAGGSTRERTHDTVRRIAAETPLRPAALPQLIREHAFNEVRVQRGRLEFFSECLSKCLSECLLSAFLCAFLRSL
jgi:5,10-methylenetetrahydrofolate reductase